MSRRRRPGNYQLSPSFLATSTFGAGILFALILRQAIVRDENRYSTLVAVSKASSVVTETSNHEPARTPKPIWIDVDGIRAAAPQPAAFHSIFDIDATVEIKSQSERRSADPALSECIRWARLETSSAPTRISPSTAGELIDLYAARSKDGVSVCVASRSQVALVTEVRAQLSGAPYRVERLTLTRPSRNLSGHQPVPQGGPAAASAELLQTRADLSRLKGVSLGTYGTVIVPMDVNPGELAILRFTDTAYASRLALNEVREQLASLSAASSELANRLHVIFSGRGCEQAISASCRVGADRRCAEIHRYLLVLGQAYSILRNFQEARTVQTVPGERFRFALERLSAALADTSATLLGLVPGIVVSPAPNQAANTPHSLSSASGEQKTYGAGTFLVTVNLSNLGSRPARLIKIGIDRDALPAGVRCDPMEPALFETLAPAQSVRATFVLRQPAASPGGMRCVGDISYFSAGAAAHLRPANW